MFDKYGYDGFYEAPIQTQKKGCYWFDGYNGQKVVLIDDFTGTIFNIILMLYILLHISYNKNYNFYMI